MRKLLIGYDGSDSAAQAIDDLSHAGLGAEGIDAVVMSIADMLPGVPGQDVLGDYSEVLARLQADATVALKEAQRCAERGAERLRRLFPSWRVAAEAATESPYWGLIKKAGQMQADLLVVGSHGRSAWGRLMLGSVSHHAVLYAPCSTRVGRRGEGPESASPTAPVQIIVGWDGSDDAAAALRVAGARHWPAGSRVRLVTALDLRLATALPAIIPTEIITVGFPPVVDDQSDALQKGMHIAAEHLRASGLVVEDPVMHRGDPKHVLIHEARAWPADCIFIGARGLSRMHRVLLGSVASAVAARADCSVEVIRPQTTPSGATSGQADSGDP